MTRTIYTYEQHNLGDQLVFLHLLRTLANQNPANQFSHFCNGCHIPNLLEVVADVPNILLTPYESPLWGQHKHEAVNVWKNAEGWWERSRHRWDWSAYALEHHAWTARRMGFESPFTNPTHLLFDYPALEQQIEEPALEQQIEEPALEQQIEEPARDFLIVDAAPHSGQYREWADHSKAPLDQLIALLKNAGHNVRTTSACKAEGYTVTQIGALSLKCQHVLGVMSGPAWTTINTTRHHLHGTEGRRNIFLLDNGERLNLPGVEQCESAEALVKIAEGAGWL